MNTLDRFNTEYFSHLKYIQQCKKIALGEKLIELFNIGELENKKYDIAKEIGDLAYQRFNNKIFSWQPFLYAGLIPLELLQFSLEIFKSYSYLSTNLTLLDGVQNDSCVLKFNISNNVTLDMLEHSQFYKKDFLQYRSSFICLETLDKVSDFYKKTLKLFLLAAKDYDIIGEAGYLYSKSYKDVKTEDSYTFYLPEKLVEVYKKFGFVNINNVIGQYEESIIICRPGKSSKILQDLHLI